MSNDFPQLDLLTEAGHPSYALWLSHRAALYGSSPGSNLTSYGLSHRALFSQYFLPQPCRKKIILQLVESIHDPVQKLKTNYAIGIGNMNENNVIQGQSIHYPS